MATETIDYVIKVEGGGAVADTDRLAQSMEKLTVATEKVSAGAQQVSTALPKVAGGAEALATGAGKSERALNEMAKVLGIVSPQGAAAARALGDVAGGFELIGTAGGAALRILGPVALAIGALGLVYKSLADDAKKAEERMNAASAAATAAAEVSATVDLNRLRAGAARGEPLAAEELRVTEATLSAEKAIPGIQEARASIADLERQIDAVAGRTLFEKATKESLPELRQQLAGAQSDLAALENQAAGLAGSIIDIGVASDEAAAAEKAAAAATKALEEAQKAAAEAAKVQAAELKKLAAEYNKVEAAAAEARLAIAQFQSVAPPAVTTTTSFGPGAALAAVDIAAAEERFNALGLSDRETFGERVSRATPDFLQRAAGIAGDVGGAVAPIVGGLASGNVSPLLAAAGPVGAAIGGISAIGDLGAEGVEDLLDGFTESVINGLRALPEILSEVIPDFVISLVTELIPALVDAFPQIIKAAVIDLPGAIAIAIGEAIAESVGFGGEDKARKRFEKIADLEGRPGFIRLFQTGGEVDKTGLALVHRGEQVIPASGAGSFNATSAAGRFSSGSLGGGVNISGNFIGPNAGNELLRMLEEAIGPGGIGATTIPGLAGVAGI